MSTRYKVLVVFSHRVTQMILSGYQPKGTPAALAALLAEYDRADSQSQSWCSATARAKHLFLQVPTEENRRAYIAADQAWTEATELKFELWDKIHAEKRS